MSTAGYDLRIGDLSLMDNRDDTFSLSALGADFSLGNAVPQVGDVISSMLRDGDLTATTRFGNRLAAFLVEIKAPDAGALAAGMAALDAVLDIPNTMTWQVPYGPDTVFDVVRSWSDWIMDDLVEVKQIKRTMRVNVECMPFGHDADDVVINWTGPGAEVSPLTSLAGWTTVSGAPLVSSGTFTGTGSGDLNVRSNVGTLTVPLKNYLWLRTNGSVADSTLLTTVKVDGTTIDPATIKVHKLADHYYIVPVHAWAGQTPTIEILLGPATSPNIAQLKDFWTVGYPDTPVTGTSRPGGIDVIQPGGSARAGFRVEFTAPAGGAWLFTCPDPDHSLRVRGAAEMQWTATATGDPFPDDYAITTTPTTTQPVDLHPNGTWPQTTFGTKSYGFPTSVVPNDSSVTWFSTSGAKAVVSATALLPEGYHGDAVHHEEHVLHAGDCGFTLLDQDGAPIACTITYKRHWKHLAA